MEQLQHLTRRGASIALRSVAEPLSLVERSLDTQLHTLIARVNIKTNKTSPAGLIQANTVDPFNKSGKYGLIWVYFGIFFLTTTSFLYFYHAITDRIRTAMHEDEVLTGSLTSSPSTDFEMTALKTDKSTNRFFPRDDVDAESQFTKMPGFWSFRPVLVAVAVFRFVFYRPAPVIRVRKSWAPITLPAFSTVSFALLGVLGSILYCFLPQPLYWQSLAFGSPPLAIRSGMMAVSLMPWIVALAMKANLISWLTGIGHERLNVLHRWGAYLCLLLSLIHAVPFYVQKIWDPAGYAQWTTYFNTQGLYIFGTGIAAFAPLAFLCIHSLPILRRKAYELFVTLHVPVAFVYTGMLFWHCRNFLSSWQYLYATIAIWASSYFARVFFLNWAKPTRVSFLAGEEAWVTMMPENAVRVTVATQVRWKPGQYVYLRMPGVEIFGNHPFTISSLCSDDLPSDMGEEYRDMALVFRPFGGFTKRVMDSALSKGPYHTYRAFVDGPYGGLKRRLESFDKVILIAGGSGITAIVSHILDLIKRMRDGKAITTSIHVIWAMKRPEILEWFKEELRICRESAPPESVKCQFFITAAKRTQPKTFRMTAQTTQDHISTYFRDTINDTFQGIADKRASYMSKRNSAYIRDEADGDFDLEKALREENEDTVTALPKAHLEPANKVPSAPSHVRNFSHPLSSDDGSSSDEEEIAPAPKRQSNGGRDLALDIQTALAASPGAHFDSNAAEDAPQHFTFGFPSTPTEFQKNLMRFAFLPAARQANDGWTTEYGRPDLPYMLRDMADDFGKRTCVFVCGPPSMRIAVSKTVADMQRYVLGSKEVEEIFLHTENYAL
ncbi:hypothetical protein BT63DRAFT_432882 [Microthyrium microscopicum]|uniref:ferric-chelate reductase (NADPH) n=1 Tax=Microthyrium microscopicum TaxID=703497 RepID=A0A6A6UDF1_9PEZI|nr:hypothetical protein BT63DRAFT_432882 [Microthyrium microscopicum]